MHSVKLLFVFLVFLSFKSAYAQDNLLPSDDPPYPCPFTNAAYYQGNVFPRFNINTRELVLVDSQTNSVIRSLDTIPEIFALSIGHQIVDIYQEQSEKLRVLEENPTIGTEKISFNGIRETLFFGTH